MTKDPQISSLVEVGGRIRKIREASGLNLHQLARLSGISAPALSQIETGKRDLRITSLYRIAVALRVAAAALLADLPVEIPDDDGLGVKGYDLKDYR